jgi:transcriptional regulator with XRE-family HTH domain
MVDKQLVVLIKQIGARLKEARYLCGYSESSPLSLSAASEMLGVDKDFLQRLESGVDVADGCQLQIMQIVKLASERYDVSVDFLFGLSCGDWERCDEVKWERQIGRGLHEYHMQELAKVVVDYERQQRKQDVLIDVMAKLLPAITAIFDSLESFRKTNKKFESMPVGSQLAYRVRLANQLVNEAKFQMMRGKVIPLPEKQK